MTRLSHLVTVSVLVLGACKGSKNPGSDADHLPPGAIALLNPRGEAEQMLGLPVEEIEGRAVIADARRPGCEVVVQKIPSQWDSHFHHEIGRTGGFTAGWQTVALLEFQYAKVLRVASSIDNVRELRADLRGPCGPSVITTVWVGTGWREMWYSKEVSGKAEANIQGVGVGGGGGDWEQIGARVAWAEEQAWAFGLGDGSSAHADITINMPAKLRSGQQFVPTIVVARDLWLIVLYRDADGNNGVVFPSPNLLAYQVAPGHPVQLPAMVITTPATHESVFETLIVYGFSEEGDFKRFAPPPGALSPVAQHEYAVALVQKLNDPSVIPSARWTSTTFGFEVAPQ
jgi:hypothetical protein